MEAAQLAQTQWIRVAANMSLGGYETFIATGDLPEPEWPDKTMQEIMDIAFKDRYISSTDHPVVRRLRGGNVIKLSSYKEVWLVDFEFSAPPGERQSVVCMVARGIQDGQDDTDLGG